MSNDDKEKKINFIKQEICLCSLLWTYYNDITIHEKTFRHCGTFFTHLRGMLFDSLITRLCCLIDNNSQSLNIEKIYKEITGKTQELLTDNNKKIINKLRNKSIAHKDINFNINDRDSVCKLVQDAKTIIPNFIQQSFEMFSDMYNTYYDANTTFSSKIIQISTADLIETLTIGSGLIDNKNYEFSSLKSGDIIGEIKQNIRKVENQSNSTPLEVSR